MNIVEFKRVQHYAIKNPYTYVGVCMVCNKMVFESNASFGLSDEDVMQKVERDHQRVCLPFRASLGAVATLVEDTLVSMDEDVLNTDAFHDDQCWKIHVECALQHVYRQLLDGMGTSPLPLPVIHTTTKAEDPMDRLVDTAKERQILKGVLDDSVYVKKPRPQIDPHKIGGYTAKGGYDEYSAYHKHGKI